MYFDEKWSDLKDSGKTEEILKQYDNKQAWQDAKARAQGYENEQERRGNSGERHLANNPDYQAPRSPREDEIPDFSGVGGTPQGPVQTPPSSTTPSGVATPSETNPAPNNPAAPQSTTSSTYTPPAERHQARMEEGGIPSVSSLDEDYATARIYRGPDWRGEGSKLYTAKEADDAGWTPGYYQNDYEWGGPTTGERNDAYRNYSDEKGEVMGMSGDWYEAFSPEKVAEFAAWEFNPASMADMTDSRRDWHETAKALALTGKSFSKADIGRNRDGGSKRGMAPHIYDYVGGYENWYQNYSLYGPDGFQGSPDLLTSDQVQGFNEERMQRYYDWRDTEDWEAKYGLYGF